MSPNIKRVLVIDDHPIVRDGIAQLFSEQPDLVVCGDAYDIASARAAARTLEPDVALVDLSLGRESGLDLIPLLLDDRPGLPILALSMHDESLYAKRVLQAGGLGYIMKHEGTDLLLHAIRTVLAGEVYVSPRLNASFLRSLTETRPARPGSAPGASSAPGAGAASSGPASARTLLAELSNRELQIYTLVGRGLTTKEIAGQLFLSVKTVESHRAHIKQKLGVDTTAALVAHAAEWLLRGSHIADGAATSTSTSASVVSSSTIAAAAVAVALK